MKNFVSTIMTHQNHIEHIIAAAVTSLALTLPVTYIRSIIFFQNRKRILYCTWNGEQPEHQVQLYKGLESGERSTAIELVVNAIDSGGRPVRFLAPCFLTTGKE